LLHISLVFCLVVETALLCHRHLLGKSARTTRERLVGLLRSNYSALLLA
jgi:hypothetical protein